jgi:hypothetical protein
MNPTLNIPTFRLSNGVPIPSIGLGTSKVLDRLFDWLFVLFYWQINFLSLMIIC